MCFLVTELTYVPYGEKLKEFLADGVKVVQLKYEDKPHFPIVGYSATIPEVFTVMMYPDNQQEIDLTRIPGWTVSHNLEYIGNGFRTLINTYLIANEPICEPPFKSVEWVYAYKDFRYMCKETKYKKLTEVEQDMIPIELRTFHGTLPRIALADGSITTLLPNVRPRSMIPNVRLEMDKLLPKTDG